MTDQLIDSLVSGLADKQLAEAGSRVAKLQAASAQAEAAAAKAHGSTSLTAVTPVSAKLLDVQHAPSAKEVAQWEQCSELGSPDARSLQPVQLPDEAALHRAVSQLASRFSALISATLGKKWYQHFEVWLFGRRADAATLPRATAQTQDTKQGPWQLILPSGDALVGGAADAELQRKLVAAGAAEAHVCAVMAELQRLPDALQGKLQASVQASPRVKVKVAPFKGQKGVVDKLRLSCLGASVEVNRSHFDKLRVLYARTAGARAGKLDPTAFTHAAMAVLLRYSSLQGTHHRGGGFQASCHAEVFDVLRRHFDCTFECFASPLNCRYTRFCSLCLDSDGPFGSLGSFAAFRPTRGSFHANPPFDEGSVQSMADHMFSLLQATQDQLMFTVVIPAWEGTACWEALAKSKHTTRHIHLLPAEHGFCEGAQHTRAAQHRAASAATSVIFLQNDAARVAWPVSDKHEALLRRAFAPQHAGSAAPGGLQSGQKGGDVMQGGDFAASQFAPGAQKHSRKAAKRARNDVVQHSATVPAKDGVELVLHASASVSTGATARHRGQTNKAQSQFDSDDVIDVLAHSQQVGAAGQPAHKKKRKQGPSSTGKFASEAAASRVLDSIVADDAADQATCNLGGAYKESEEDGAADRVTFFMSKSQCRAKRRQPGKQRRSARGKRKPP